MHHFLSWERTPKVKTVGWIATVRQKYGTGSPRSDFSHTSCLSSYWTCWYMWHSWSRDMDFYWTAIHKHWCFPVCVLLPSMPSNLNLGQIVPDGNGYRWFNFGVAMSKVKVIKRSKETKPLLGIQHIQVQAGVHLHVTHGGCPKVWASWPCNSKVSCQGTPQSLFVCLCVKKIVAGIYETWQFEFISLPMVLSLVNKTLFGLNEMHSGSSIWFHLAKLTGPFCLQLISKCYHANIEN